MQRPPNFLLWLGLLAMVALVVISFMKVRDVNLMSVSALRSAECPAPLTADQVALDIADVMRGTAALPQNHPKLIQKIRTEYLHPPSSAPYALTGGNDDPSQGQSTAIREVLGGLRGGFFVECGALDGETRSNSLVFEKQLGWTGLLVEGDPKNYEMVVQKRRKAWTSNVCLSTKPYPHSVMFQQHFNLGKISSYDVDAGTNQPGLVEVQCLPFYSLWLALNLTTVHYFSLDVEGFELDVLETIPWDKVDIKTLSVEFVHGPKGKAALRTYMEGKGYWVHKGIRKTTGLNSDWIFVKSSYKSPSDVRRVDPIKTEQSTLTARAEPIIIL